jgi:hypothetical protein
MRRSGVYCTLISSGSVPRSRFGSSATSVGIGTSPSNSLIRTSKPTPIIARTQRVVKRPMRVNCREVPIRCVGARESGIAHHSVPSSSSRATSWRGAPQDALAAPGLHSAGRLVSVERCSVLDPKERATPFFGVAPCLLRVASTQSLVRADHHGMFAGVVLVAACRQTDAEDRMDVDMVTQLGFWRGGPASRRGSGIPSSVVSSTLINSGWVSRSRFGSSATSAGTSRSPSSSLICTSKPTTIIAESPQNVKCQLRTSSAKSPVSTPSHQTTHPPARCSSDPARCSTY